MECLASIFETVKKVTVEVWLVDNASIDGSVEAAKTKYPDINVIQNERNLGFAAANNLAFKQMKGSYALLLNTDATLIDSAAEELFNFMEANPKVGIACGQLLNTDGSKQNSIANFPTLTVSAPVYATTAGNVVVAQPTTTDHVIRVLGSALTANEFFFNPSPDYTTHT